MCSFYHILNKCDILDAKIELLIVKIICCLTVLTSSMTEQMCLTHWVMACGVPEIVTALSVESGSMSPATWTWAPVVLALPDGKRNKSYLELKRSPKLKCWYKYPQITPNTFWHAKSSCKPNSNVCSNIWRGAYKYCLFRMSIQPPSIFTGIINGIFVSSCQDKYTNLKVGKNKKSSLTKVECLILEHRRWCFRSPFECRKTISWSKKKRK